jgi:hypothetical protein
VDLDTNVWPINSPMFSYVFVLACAFAALLALCVQRVLGDLFDSERPSSPLLRIGALPRLDDALLYANSVSRARLRTTLLVAAVADGWLLESSTREGFVVVADAPTHKSLAGLHDELARLPRPLGKDAVLAAASRAADRLALDRKYDQDLDDSGFRRTGLARFSAIIAPLAVAVPVGALLAMRSMFLDAHQGVGMTDASAAVLALALVPCLVIALFLGREGKIARAYREWIREHTEALREDVADGRRKSVADVALAYAIYGDAVLVATGPRDLAVARGLLAGAAAVPDVPGVPA